MKASAWLIAAGYGLLVWQFGVWGLLAAAAHLAVLGVTARRK